MGEAIEILVYIILGIIVLYGAIPVMLYLWGSMLAKGILRSYFQLLNEYKNVEKEEK